MKIQNRNIFKKYITPAAVVFGLMFFAAFAFAQERGLCMEDMEKFCKDVQHGGGRMHECLQRHEAELSPGCRENMSAVKGMARDAHKACMDDVDRFCRGVEPGGGKIAKCLKDHQSVVSPECKKEVDRMKGMEKKPVY